MTVQELIVIVPLILTTAYACQAPSSCRSFCVDLSSGAPESIPAGMGMTWQGYQAKSGKCSDQAVLKFVPPCWARALSIYETSDSSATGWTFNLGDSPSNNGWAGDANHEKYDAEYQIRNNVFQVYKNDHCGSTEYTGFRETVPQEHAMHMRIQRHGMQRQFYPGNNRGICNSRCLFEWDEFYLGMNRVVSSRYRSGYGLCQVCLTWETDNFTC